MENYFLDVFNYNQIQLYVSYFESFFIMYIKLLVSYRLYRVIVSLNNKFFFCLDETHISRQVIVNPRQISKYGVIIF